MTSIWAIVSLKVHWSSPISGEGIIIHSLTRVSLTNHSLAGVYRAILLCTLTRKTSTPSVSSRMDGWIWMVAIPQNTCLGLGAGMDAQGHFLALAKLRIVVCLHRICPGQNFAEASLFILCASVLSMFDIGPPKDSAGRPIGLEHNDATLSLVS